jgi:hypothetical protein
MRTIYWMAPKASCPGMVGVAESLSSCIICRRVRGLGFIGILVSGSHHQPHHFAMAKGEFAHPH